MSSAHDSVAPAPSGSVAHYLCLAPVAAARERLIGFAERGLYLLPEVPTTTAEAHTLAKQGTLTLTLAYLPDPARAGEALSQNLKIRSVLFPPLVVLVDRPPTPAEQETLRLQGAAYILHAPIDPARDTPALMSLMRSNSWLSAKLERMPLADALQTMAAHNQSGMVSIACRHMRFHSAHPWKHAQDICRARRSGDLLCPGWYGRLYVHHGMLVHAETPTAEGVSALAQMLRAFSGSVRVHELYILPKEPNITGTINSNLLNAAWYADEEARNAPPSGPPSNRLAQLPSPPAAAEPRRIDVSAAQWDEATPLSIRDFDLFPITPAASPAKPGDRPAASPAPLASAGRPAARLPVTTGSSTPAVSRTEPSPPMVAPAPAQAASPAVAAAPPRLRPPRPAAPAWGPAKANATAPAKTDASAPAKTDAIAPAPALDKSARPSADVSNTKGSAPMAGIDSLLISAPELRVVATADKSGNVREMAGEGDAETLCAVVALGLRPLDSVAELISLGNLRSWTIATPKLTLYVQHQSDGFSVALGDPTKNVEATMRLLSDHVAAGRGKG